MGLVPVLIWVGQGEGAHGQALQDVLEQIYKIERELEEIPKAILTEKELLTRLKKQFVEKSGNLEKRQLKVKELKSQLHDAEDKRSGY